MSEVQDIYPADRVILREVGLRDGLQLVKRFPSTTAKQRWVREEYAAGVRHFEVGSFLPAKSFPQFADVRDIVATVRELPGAHGIVLALNERGVNEALASGVGEIASVVSATEEHSQANANRSRQAAIANVKRLCELRDASAHKPIVHAAISMALGCSIAGAVDPREVLRLVEKCFEAGVDAVGSPTPSAMPAPRRSAIYQGGRQVRGIKAGLRPPPRYPRHGHRECLGRAGFRCADPRRLAWRPRRLSVRARRHRQCRVRGSGVPVREQGFCHRHRYRKIGRRCARSCVRKCRASSSMAAWRAPDCRTGRPRRDCDESFLSPPPLVRRSPPSGEAERGGFGVGVSKHCSRCGTPPPTPPRKGGAHLFF